MAITLAELVYSELIGLVQRTRVSYPACFNKIRLGVGEVKFTGQVLPTAKKVTYRIHFKRIVNRRLIMGLADGEVLVDGRLIYTASDLKVGLFQDTSAF